MRKVLIGYVGVDSGQLMLVDPCYIDGHWIEREFINVRTYTNDDGDSLVYPTDFTSYEMVIDKHGKTMNQLVREGTYKEADIPTTGEFSYDGACRATLSNRRCGAVDIGMTNAVVFSSGYGDGSYPVYAYYNKDNRIVKVEVIMK